MELVFAYVAGLLTLINPCVLPVLPVVIGSALQTSSRGPLALAAGLSLSFVVLGVFVTSFGFLLGVTEENISKIGAVVMIGFGFIILSPQLSSAFSTASAGVAMRADAHFGRLKPEGLAGLFIGGLLLGAVWSPCIGPTLGAAISLAAMGQALGRAAVIMSAFALGVSTLILVLGFGARRVLLRYRGLAYRARPVLGGVFILVGLAILLRLHHSVEELAIDVLPPWLLDLSVRF